MLPDQILINAAETFKERGKIYGDNYKRIGDVMMALIPEGKHFEPIDADDWHRFHLFFMIVVKLTRLAETDITYKDSVHDIIVYAAMLESLMEEK